VLGQSTDHPDGKLSNKEYLIVERNEQTPDVLCLGEMSIKLLVQVFQHGLSDDWV
jgi:hypothetical protein